MGNVEKLEQICRDVISLDSKMRSARLINGRGRLIAGGMRDGLMSLEAQKQDEMMFMELALRVRMRHEFDEEFGQVHFSLSYRDKVIVMSFPLSDDDVLMVSCEKDADFGRIPFEVLKVVKSLRPAGMKNF